MPDPPAQTPAEAEAPPAPRPRARFDELDGLRGVAILGVTFYHIWGNAAWGYLGRVLTPVVGTGYLGVTWFFVISGFLLTYSRVAAQAEGRPRPRWTSFYARRALRILPPFYLACAVWVVMPTLAYGLPLVVDPLVVISHFTLTYALFPGLYRELSPAGYWFIGTISHLYLLFPLLFFALGRRFWGFLALTLAISVVTRIWAFAPTSPAAVNLPLADVIQASAPGHVFEFVAGMAVGYLAPRWLREGRTLRWGSALSLLGVAACLAYPFLIFRAHGIARVPTYPGAGILYAALLFVIIVHGGPVRRLLQWRLLRVLGAISYSMYLYNFLPFALFSGRLPWLRADSLTYWALAFLTVAAAGALSHLLTERPFIALRGRLRPASRS